MKFEDQDRSFVSPKEWSDVSPLSGKKESGGHDEDLRFRDYLFRNALTGLPNRLKLIHDISVNESPVLFIINIDQFNQINNLLGLESGDAILISLGEKLLYHLHDHPGILYKLQADEYAVLMNISGSEPPWAKIEKIANHLIAAVERDRIHVSTGLSPEGYEVALSITIGISCARVVGKENLVTAADIALKTAKNRRLPFLFYRHSEETKRRYERNIHWAKVIRDAVIDDRIVPYYQPILNNVTKKVEKYEALVRLLDDQGVPVLPDEFIELSKAIRMYPEITRVMIRKSFQAFRNSPFELSINLNVQDILDQDLIGYILGSVSSLRIGNRMTFEILESEGIESYPEVTTVVNQLKELGCKISIDDFGTGYSNFAHLIRLKVDFIKIDASLIRNIEHDTSSQLLVKAIVKFSGEMGIRTVAEYVHSAPVHKIVSDIGVDYAQGYFIGEPSASI